MPGLHLNPTPLIKRPELCGRYCATVWEKDEGKNPSGTLKDRRCAAILEANAGKGDIVLVHITTGNSGYSMGMMAKHFEEAGKRRIVVNIVPPGIPRSVREKLDRYSIVHEMDLGNEIITLDVMRKVARAATHFEGPDSAIIGVEDYKLHNGYRMIAREILEAGVKPDYIFCPVGEGELAIELAEESSMIWGQEAPKIVGVTIPGNVLLSQDEFIRKPGKSIADKLVNGYSKFKALVNKARAEGRLELTCVQEKDIIMEYEFLNRIGVNVEPSAAAAFAGAAMYSLKPDDIVVIVNTGKGNYDRNATECTLARRISRSLKYAAAAIGGAAAMMLAFWASTSASIDVRGDTILLDTPSKTYEFVTNVNEADPRLWIIRETLRRAFNYADYNSDARLSPGELRGICSMIPDCNSDDVPGDLEDFTEAQLNFFSTIERAQRTIAFQGMTRYDIERTNFYGEYEEDVRSGTYGRNVKIRELKARILGRRDNE